MHSITKYLRLFACNIAYEELVDIIVSLFLLFNEFFERIYLH